jgi:hypothetical protein
MQGIISFITARTSRIITFGCIYLLVSILLISYYSFKSPVRLEDYYFIEITYQKVYFKETADNIIIVSDAKEYRLPISYLNWQSKIDLVEAVRNLSSTTKAEVWLENKDINSPLVKGIKTDSFYFSPEVGTDIDNKYNKSMAELFFWFAIGGIVVIIIGLIKFFADKK